MTSPLFAKPYDQQEQQQQKHDYHRTSTPLIPRSINAPSHPHSYYRQAMDSPASPFALGYSEVAQSNIYQYSGASMPPSPPITPPSIFYQQQENQPSRPALHHENTPVPSRPIFSLSYPIARTDFSTSAATAQTKAPIRNLHSNPLVGSNSENRRKRRREEFLGSVRRKREDDVFGGRGDRMLLMDHMSEQRKWEEARAASAPEMDEDEGAESPTGYISPELRQIPMASGRVFGAQDHATHNQRSLSSTAKNMSDNLDSSETNALLEARLREEEQELEALVAMHQKSAAPTYWDSDEDEDMDFESGLWQLGDGGGGGISAGMQRQTSDIEVVDGGAKDEMMDVDKA